MLTASIVVDQRSVPLLAMIRLFQKQKQNKKPRAAGVAAELRPGLLRGWRRCFFLAGVGALRASG